MQQQIILNHFFVCVYVDMKRKINAIQDMVSHCDFSVLIMLFSYSDVFQIGKCVDGVRHIPIKMLDVAGLVPGASEGKV
jgi:ribosome-binding ATPase YchF (GTP1/OBG family)